MYELCGVFLISVLRPEELMLQSYALFPRSKPTENIQRALIIHRFWIRRGGPTGTLQKQTLAVLWLGLEGVLKLTKVLCDC